MLKQQLLGNALSGFKDHLSGGAFPETLEIQLPHHLFVRQLSKLIYSSFQPPILLDVDHWCCYLVSFFKEIVFMLFRGIVNNGCMCRCVCVCGVCVHLCGCFVFGMWEFAHICFWSFITCVCVCVCTRLCVRVRVCICVLCVCVCELAMSKWWFGRF